MDLSQKTLSRRRALKPLINQLQAKNISYRWGLAACLVAKNQGISATLRFPEDLKDFCSKLDLPYINLEMGEVNKSAMEKSLALNKLNILGS